MARYRLSAAARADIKRILAWSHERFGAAARLRYEALIVAALTDVAAEPERAGSSARPELGEDVRVWHLRHSRKAGNREVGAVHRPRHFLIYRIEGDLVVIGRVLHDAMDLVEHMESGGK